jgi:hypothetical protein
MIPPTEKKDIDRKLTMSKYSSNNIEIVADKKPWMRK